MDIERQSDLALLAAQLGHNFEDLTLLDTALTHTSWAVPRREVPNERLEFLGDSVMDLIVAEFLMERFPKEREGFLSQRRADIVRMENLAHFARAAGLFRHLLVGKGSEKIRLQPSVLADTLEACVGAGYTDGGLAAARTMAHGFGVLR